MIVFDHATHIYRDKAGVIVPGVTGILKDAGLIDTAWFDDYATNRGALIHQACALFDRDDLDESSLDSVIEPYVRAWKKFRMETGFAPMAIEEIIYDPVYRYAGTLDVRGRLGQRLAIIDRKSGTAQSWVGLQLAAYEYPLEDYYDRYAIELNGDGKYRLIKYEDRNDFNVFLAALAIVNWKHNKGVK